MSQLLIESICCIDGIMTNIHYHNIRMNKSRYKLFGCTNDINISDNIALPDFAKKGIWKLRIYYNATIRNIELEPYTKRAIRTLQIIYDDTIDYSFKYADRSHIIRLFEQRGIADDILIIKNGYVTDSSFANVALYDGKEWFTPSTPLLAGTKRAKLIDEGIIKEKPITVNDLDSFTYLSLINAFLDIGDVLIPTSYIKL